MSERTGVLSARPSFLDGISRIFDFFGVQGSERARSIIEQSDEDAIRRDWEIVGQDFRRAIAIETAKHPELRK